MQKIPPRRGGFFSVARYARTAYALLALKGKPGKTAIGRSGQPNTYWARGLVNLRAAWRIFDSISRNQFLISEKSLKSYVTNRISDIGFEAIGAVLNK